MPKYRLYEVTKVKRLEAKFPVSLPSPEEIAKHMTDQGILNRDELARLRAEIDKKSKEAESSFIGKLSSLIYYWVKDQIKISPETLYRIMSNFDKIKDFMPNDFWKGTVEVIDKIGEHLYDKERAKSE